jgi:hypothetical protein
MLKKITILVLLLSAAASLAPCEPFGLRIYYGDIVKDAHSSDKLGIYFNTK